MRKQFAKLSGKLKSNNGSGIITVLVAMMFISFLGATLLFTSYTGYKIKVSERGGKESFYDAGAAMDEIKSGIQQAVTESLSTAYTDVLSEYTALSEEGGTAIQDKFSQVFVADLSVWETDAGHDLFSVSPSTPITYTYSVDALKDFLSTAPTGAVVSDSGGGCKVTEETYGDDTYLRLEDISVTYTSADGYESNVTTDIVVTMPDFHATTSTVVSSELPSFALIADGTLASNINDPILTGNAYVGALSLSASGNNLDYTSGTFVCAGNAEIGNGALFRTYSGSELWAGNITLGTSGTADLYGRTFVADDLTFSGNDSSAELKGSYYGIGSGESAAASSAIVVNGKNSVLDIDSLDRLVLAGVAFVNMTESDVQTGESVAAKSNQLAYLIDKDCISVSAYFDNNSNGVFDAGDTAGTVTGDNPCIFTGDRLSYSIDTAAALWGGTHTLDYYGVKVNADGTYSGITPVAKNLAGTGGYKMAYFFIKFSSQDKANEYFRDYFSANLAKIKEYLGVYVDLGNKASITATAGNTLYSPSAGSLSLYADSASVNVAGRMDQFSNRCQTLNPSKPGAGYTPFTYYVDTGKIAVITEPIEFKLPGDTVNIVGRIIKGDYTVNADESAKVIIATGNVTVSSAFSGLIIAGGNATMNADVTYLLSDVENIIYKSVDSAGKLLSSYMKNTVAGEDDSSGFISSWDLDLLVSYDNWSKN